MIAAASKQRGKEEKRMSKRVPTFGVAKSLQNAGAHHSQNASSKLIGLIIKQRARLFTWKAASGCN